MPNWARSEYRNHRSRQQLALHTAPLVRTAISLLHVVGAEERETAFEFGQLGFG
jgi:hypothetical protein